MFKSPDNYPSFMNAIKFRGEDGRLGYYLRIPLNRKEARVYFKFLMEMGMSYGGGFRDERHSHQEPYPSAIWKDDLRFRSVCKKALQLWLRNAEGAAEVTVKNATGLPLDVVHKVFMDHDASKYSTQPKMLALRLAYTMNDRVFSPEYARKKGRKKRTSEL